MRTRKRRRLQRLDDAERDECSEQANDAVGTQGEEASASGATYERTLKYVALRLNAVVLARKKSVSPLCGGQEAVAWPEKAVAPREARKH